MWFFSDQCNIKRHDMNKRIDWNISVLLCLPSVRLLFAVRRICPAAVERAWSAKQDTVERPHSGRQAQPRRDKISQTPTTHSPVSEKKMFVDTNHQDFEAVTQQEMTNPCILDMFLTISSHAWLGVCPYEYTNSNIFKFIMYNLTVDIFFILHTCKYMLRW